MPNISLNFEICIGEFCVIVRFTLLHIGYSVVLSLGSERISIMVLFWHHLIVYVTLPWSGGVLNCELGTGVRPDVSTTTL